MGVFNNDIQISTTIGAPPVVGTAFGQLIYLAKPGSLGAGFTERVRRYTQSSEIAADLVAGDITQSVADALNAALRQPLHTGTLPVGRMDSQTSGDAQETEITYSGTTTVAGDRFVLDVDGVSVEYIAGAGENPVQLTGAIFALMIADSRFDDFDIGVTDAVIDVVTNTDYLRGVAIDITAIETSAGISSAVVNTVEPTGDLAGQLDDIIAADSDWYGITSEYVGTGWQKVVASFAETTKRLHLVETHSLLDLEGDAAGLTAQLKALAYEYSTVLQPGPLEENAAYVVGVSGLDGDLDISTKTWSKIQPTGLTNPQFTTTQRTALEAENGNLIGDFFGTTVYGEGKTAKGRFIDQRTTVDWINARVREGLARAFLNASARGSKIPFDNPGIQQFASVVRAVFQQGVEAGHFVVVTNATTGALISPIVSAPLLSQVTTADRQNRLLRLTYVATFAGAIHKGDVAGFIDIPF